MPTASKRFLMVLVDSSMAMMPLPAATMAWAVSASWSILMAIPEVWLGAGHYTRLQRAGPGATAVPGPATGSEFAQTLGVSVRPDLQQAQGVGGPVQLHGIAAGQDDPVALGKQAGPVQLRHRLCRRLPAVHAVAVEIHREGVAHQGQAPARRSMPGQAVDRRPRAEPGQEAGGAAGFGQGDDG